MTFAATLPVQFDCGPQIYFVAIEDTALPVKCRCTKYVVEGGGYRRSIEPHLKLPFPGACN